MNCFEARQEFPAFWRKELAPQRRSELTAHLAECPGCDLAFRTFALSAPLMHSDREPPALADPVRAGAAAAQLSHRPVSNYSGAPRRMWASAGAAAAMLTVGIFAAYFSVSAPVQSISDAISQPSPFVEVFGADVTETGGDFAG